MGLQRWWWLDQAGSVGGVWPTHRCWGWEREVSGWLWGSCSWFGINPRGLGELVGQEDWGREHFWVFGKGASIGGPPGSQQLHQAHVTVFL